MRTDQFAKRWRKLGEAGLTVSISNARGEWSVRVADHERAFTGFARTMQHCMEIAETESKSRGWILNDRRTI